MDYDYPISFEYIDYTGTDGKDLELFWKVNYRNGKQLSIITKVSKGIPQLLNMNIIKMNLKLKISNPILLNQVK